MAFQSKSTFTSCRDVMKYLAAVKAHLQELEKIPGVDGQKAMHDFFIQEYNNFKGAGIDKYCNPLRYPEVNTMLLGVTNQLPKRRNAAINAIQKIQEILYKENMEGGRKRSTRKKAKRTRRTRRR